MKTIQVVLVSLFLVFISCGDKTPKGKEVVLPVKKVETPVKTVDEEVKEPSLIFSVQIGAFSKENQKFAAIENVVVSNENGLFKYRLGAFETYNEARSLRRNLRNIYPGAFIQAVKNGEKVEIREALKSK
ncbi:SPOR domain-containing protein [Polaribacter gochangensis]|uniref:SPOR domain-containing protein n=1 Tax=Polaribacter gochangensis TaxID=3252903 RepID=UPI0039048D4E